MKTHFNPKNNPRVIIIQKLYGKFYNEDNDIEFPKHRFKKFIKDIVFGTIERNDLILDELNNKLGDDFVLDNLDKVFQTILKAATYEFLYKPNISINIIIKEYLNSSNFFLEDSQTKYLTIYLIILKRIILKKLILYLMGMIIRFYLQLVLINLESFQVHLRN